MSISFPVAAVDFVFHLNIGQVRFWLERYEEASGTGAGDVLVAELAPPKWRATITLSRMTNAKAAAAKALIDRMGSSGQFFVYDPSTQFPAYDPTGAIVAGAVPKIAEVGYNNHRLRLGGLPPSYRISRGDFLSYAFGSSPTRYALVQAAETVTASGVGLTPFFDTSCPLRAGTVAGLNVSLRRPAAKMIRYPGSFDAGAADKMGTSGMTFQAIEVR